MLTGFAVHQVEDAIHSFIKTPGKTSDNNILSVVDDNLKICCWNRKEKLEKNK